MRNLVHKILQLTHGRTTAFFIAFFISGNVFHALHNLSGNYVAFMGTLGGLVIGHSFKEDYAEKMNGPRQDGGPDANPNASAS